MLFYMTLVHQLPLKSTLYKKGAPMEGSRLMEIWDDLGGPWVWIDLHGIWIS